MAAKHSLRGALKKLFQLVNLERREIRDVYIYAIFNGIIYLSLPLGIQAIINLLFGATISTSLIVMIIIVITGVLLNGVVQIKQMRISERIQQRIFTRLTFAYAYRIPKINLSSIDDYYLPELVNRFFDTASLQKGLSKLLIDFPGATIQVLFGLILLSFYHPVFILFGLLLISMVVFIFYLTSPKGFDTSIKESDYKYEVAHWLEEVSRSIKTFKYAQHTDLHLHKTDGLVDGYLKAREEHFSILVFQYRIIIAFKVLITAAMLIIGAVLFVNQQINLGQFIATEIIILAIIGAIEKLIISLEVVYDVLTSLEKINKVLDKPQDKEEGMIKDIKDTSGIALTVKNLTFGFKPKFQILKNISFHIASGEKVCLKGIEGSGKSTLLKVLTGMWPDFEGNILFNDVSVKSMTPDAIYHQIGFYFNEDELFNGSIIENITLNRSTDNMEAVYEVCRLVGLTDFINDKQEGYLLQLDPQGKKLPHNIVQKILLARCLYRKPALMILEDGWLRMEPEARARIINYLTAAENKFTLIAVSNDEDFCRLCDKVMLMKDGTTIQVN